MKKSAFYLLLLPMLIWSFDMHVNGASLVNRFDKLHINSYVETIAGGINVPTKVSQEYKYDNMDYGVAVEDFVGDNSFSGSSDFTYNVGDITIAIYSKYDKSNGVFQVSYSKSGRTTGNEIQPITPLVSANSEAYPGWFVRVSPDNQVLAVVIMPKVTKRKFVNNVPIDYTVKTHAEMHVYTDDMEIIWKKTLKYDDENKSFLLTTAVDNLGNLYCLNAISAPSTITKVKGHELMCFNESGDKTIPITDLNINKALLECSNDAVTLYGLKRPKNEYFDFSDGTFFLKMQLETMSVITKEVNDLSMETMEMFITNNFLHRQLKKGRGIVYLHLSPLLSFEDGTKVLISRHIAPMTTGSPLYDYGSILVSIYSPDGEYREQVIRLSQRSTSSTFLTYKPFVFGNTLTILFNDDKANANILDQSEPAHFFTNVSGAFSDNAITSAVQINSDGTAKRITVADYQKDKFMLLSAQSIDGIHWELSGTDKLDTKSQDSGQKWMSVTIE